MATVSDYLVALYRPAVERELRRPSLISETLARQLLNEQQMDERYGPVLGPGRREWWQVWHMDRKRERARGFLERAPGRMAGPFVRAS
jgi:hypothetical protein